MSGSTLLLPPNKMSNLYPRPVMQLGHQRRTVYYTHEITDDYDDDVIEAIDGEYDIDIGILDTTIQANVTKQHAPGSRMPFTCWKSLPQETGNLGYHSRQGQQGYYTRIWKG